MKIDIFKTELFYNLANYNQDILDVGDKYTYDGFYGARKGGNISGWFDPTISQKLPNPMTWPYPNADQLGPEYCLLLYVSNYLSIFLINTLYKDRKDVLIEDAGSGIGKQLFYLSKLGFTNLQGLDNWSQSNEEMFIDIKKKASCDIRMNDLNSKPVIVTANMSDFTFLNPRFGYNRDKKKIAEPKDIENIELISFYVSHFEPAARKILPKLGFRKLCIDDHSFGVSYCREDKHAEFTEKLKEYEQ